MSTEHADSEIDVNRRYFVWYVSQVAAPPATVLDFGCGAGTVVRLLRATGYEAFGVDVKGWGFDPPAFRTEGLPDGTLRYYEEGGALPFGDDTFDVIVSDMVFEHVVPIDAAVAELDRVLKPNGVMYHHFPSRTLIREAHIGIPLAHRLPAGQSRLHYAACLRRLGVGAQKDERTPTQWAADSLAWVDRFTVYRDIADIHRIFGTDGTVRHREIDYCRFRAGTRRWLAVPLRQRWLRRPAEALFRRLAFEAIEVRPKTR